MLESLPPYEFSFERWGAGSLATFGIATRFDDIQRHKRVIRQYAIGYCPGEKLSVRPKPGTIAVLFFFEGEHFWTHLMEDEFRICFPEPFP